MVKKELLDILACPICKVKVDYDKKNGKIICPECGRKYPIEDGIPVMLVERAEEDKSEER